MSHESTEQDNEVVQCHSAFVRTKHTSKHGDISYSYKIDGFWSHESVVLEIEADLQGRLRSPQIRWNGGGIHGNTPAPLAARNIAAALLDAAEVAEQYM